MRTRVRTLVPIALAFRVAAGAIFAVARTIRFDEGGLRSALVPADLADGPEGFEWSSAAVGPPARQRQVLDRQSVLAAVLAAIVSFVALLAALSYELLRNLSRRREVAIHRAVGASWRMLWGDALQEGVLLTGFGLTAGFALGGALTGMAVAGWPGSVSASVGPVATLLSTVVLASAFLAFLLGSWQAGVVSGTGLPGTTFAAPPPDPYSGIAVLQVAASVALLVSAAVLVGGGGTPSGGGAGQALHADDVDGPAARGMVATIRSGTPIDTARLLTDLSGVPGLTSAWVASPGALTGLGTTDMALTECGNCMIGTSPVNMKGEDAVHHALAWLGSDTPIELAAGRTFGPDDGPDDEPVALVSETFAQQHFERGEAIGRRVRPGVGLGGWHRVIGIVREGRPRTAFAAGAQPESEVYVSAVQHPGRSVEVWVGGSVEEVEVVRRIRASHGRRGGRHVDRCRTPTRHDRPLAVAGRVLRRVRSGGAALLALRPSYRDEVESSGPSHRVGSAPSRGSNPLGSRPARTRPAAAS